MSRSDLMKGTKMDPIYEVQYLGRLGGLEAWFDLRSFSTEAEAWAYYDLEIQRPWKREIRVVIKTTTVLERAKA